MNQYQCRNKRHHKLLQFEVFVNIRRKNSSVIFSSLHLVYSTLLTLQVLVHKAEKFDSGWNDDSECAVPVKPSRL